MITNGYDIAAEAPIINTYVPIDFGELYKIGAAQKDAVDKTYKDLNTNLQKWSEFTSPSQIDINNWYKYTTGNPVISNLIERAANNPDALKDAAFRANLQSAINSIDYSTLSRLKQGAESLSVRQKITAEMKAKGLYKESWDVYRDKQGNLQNFDATNWDTLNQGILEDLSPVQYSSLFDIVNPYVEGLKPTFYEGNVNPLTGRSMSFVKGYNAITRETINDILDRNINEIVNTPQGQLWYRDIANTVRTINPNATQQDIDSAFVENLRKNAYYKLVATPVDDAFAMRQALQQAEYRMKLKYKQAENQQAGQLSWEDILSTQNAQAIKNNVEAIRQGDPGFTKKYQDGYDTIAENITNVAQIAMQNPEFRQLMELAVTQSGASTEQAIDFAFKNSQSLSNEIVKTYNDLQSNIFNLRNNEIDEATGKILQRTFNATLGKSDMNSNPFEGVRTQLQDGQMYYDESLVHQMYEDGLYQISQQISPQVKVQLENMMFTNDKKISTEVGYTFAPSGKLISPKKFISNNNYINNLAESVGFNIADTKLNRGSWSGDQDFDIEEKVAKGEFGSVAISDIVGYLDTPGERGFVVRVNVPLTAIQDKYRTWMTSEGSVRENLDKTYQITIGDGEDSDNLPGRWKDGYITTTMLMPVSNDDLDKIQANRLWQKDIGTSATKEKQIGIDDTILTNAKNYRIGFGLTK